MESCIHRECLVSDTTNAGRKIGEAYTTVSTITTWTARSGQ